MPEEIKTTEQTITPDAERQDPTNPRETPAFLGLQRQAAELKRSNEEMAAKLEMIQTAEEEKQRAALEEQGKYEELRKQLEEDRAKLQAQLEEKNADFKRTKLEAEFDRAALLAGLNDELVLEGARHRYLSADEAERPSADDYVVQLKEQHAHLFSAPGTPPLPASTDGTTATRSGGDWAQVKADLRDPAKAEAADKRVRQYIEEKGEMPPGF